MPVFRIGERGISCWARRREISEERETILFIHGAGGSQLSWIFQKAFLGKEFDPMIIDLPGHGDSGGDGEEEIESYAGHIDGFLRALNLERLYLVGHSMGGAIVQTLAISRPEVIKGIVLVGTGARLKVLPWVLKEVENSFEETVRKIVRYAFSRRASPELIEGGIEHLMKCPPKTLYGDFLACDRFDLMREVEKIGLPTQIICGEEDELTPVKYSEFLHQRIRTSRLEILPSAGHMVMLESPDVFNLRVREFIMDSSKRQG